MYQEKRGIVKLEGKSLGNDFIRFIIPSIVAQWVFAIYTMVDGIFVANGVSEIALTAVNIVMPYIMALYAVSILFAVGTSTVTAINLGEGNLKKACQIFTQNIVFLVVLSIVITVFVMSNLKTIAVFLGATDVNMKYVLEYLGSIVPFSGLFILSYSFETLIKTDGYPKMATLIVTVGSVVNVILDYIMVMRLHMGVRGAALATGIAHVLLITLYLLHFCGKKGTIKFTKFTFDFSLMGREIKNGVSSGITELSAGLIVFLFNHAIVRYINEDALVSYTIISYVNSIGIMTMAGIAQGYQPLISYYYGKKEQKKYKKLFRYGVQAVLVASILYTGLCMVATEWIVSLFISKDIGELYFYSVKVFRIFALSFLIAGYNIVIGGYFTAVEKPVEATIISLSRTVVALTAILYIFTWLFQGAGIWWTPLAAEGITLIITALFWAKNRRE